MQFAHPFDHCFNRFYEIKVCIMLGDFDDPCLHHARGKRGVQIAHPLIIVSIDFMKSKFAYRVLHLKKTLFVLFDL